MAENSGDFLGLMNAGTKKEYENFKQMMQIQDNERLWRFFCVLGFRVVPLEELRKEISLRLHRLVAGGEVALAVVKEEIRRITARMEGDGKRSIYEKNFHLTRQRLLDILENAGCRVTPLRSEEELKHYFEEYSLQGKSWPRDIDAHHFPRRETQELQRLVDKGQNVLLTGEAGAGKTCILLDLWDDLKNRSDIFPVFLQARDLGRQRLEEVKKNFADAAARLAERKKLVVVVDSLDVLSMAGEEFFGPMRGMLEQLRPLKDVSVVAACRKFDFGYDPHFNMFRPWEKVEVKALDWEHDIRPWLENRGVEVSRLSEKQKALISLPRMLGMFLFVWQQCGGSEAVTPWELAEEYLNQLGRNRTDWPEIRKRLEDIALCMLKENRLSMRQEELELAGEHLRFCESEGVLWEESLHLYTFIHQTWTDWLAVNCAMRSGKSLLEFITDMSARPSLRAAVRVFFFALRKKDASRFRREVREVLSSKETAFHFKWLLAVSMAEVEPEARDVSLLSREMVAPLFFAFLDAAEPKRWFAFLWKHLLPKWKDEGDLRSMARFGLWCGTREGVDSAAVVRLWTDLLDTRRGDSALLHIALFFLNDVSDWNLPELRGLFERLIAAEDIATQVLGKPLSKWVDAVNGNDDLLWRFITRNVKPVRMAGSLKPACGAGDFYRKDFLEGRLRESEALLNMALASMDEWSLNGGRTLEDGRTRYFFYDCIREKAPGGVHNIDRLFSVVTQTCIDHAKNNSPWWRNHAAKLWASDELGLRYMCLCGLLVHPQGNPDLMKEALSHLCKTPCGVLLQHPLARLLRNAAPYLEKDFLEKLQRELIALGQEAPDDAVHWTRYLAVVPAPYRLPESAAILEKEQVPVPDEAGTVESMRFGVVVSPCDEDTLLKLSDHGLLRLLRYYSVPGSGEQLREYVDGHFMGGAEQLARALSSAARRNPEAFWPRMSTWPKDIAPLFADAVMEGVAYHAWSRFGNLTISEAKPMVSLPSREWLWEALAGMGAMAEKRNGQVDTAIALLTACSWLVSSREEAERLRDIVAWTDRLSAGHGNDTPEEFESSARGNWVSAVCRLAERLREGESLLPSWLHDVILAFAADARPGPRAVLLHHLASMDLSPEESWMLFDKAVTPGPADIWDFAMEYLYDRAYADHKKVMDYVDAAGALPLKNSADMLAFVLTQSFLLQRMSQEEYRRRLSALNHAEVWMECMRILVFHACDDLLRESCFEGIRHILACRKEDRNIVSESIRLFDKNERGFLSVPYDIADTVLTIVRNFPEWFMTLYSFPEWCRYYAGTHCREALALMVKFWEMPRAYWGKEKGDMLCELLKIFFQEADEAKPEDDIRPCVDRLVETILKKEPGAVQVWLEDSVRR